MTLLEYLKSLDPGGTVIYPDEFNPEGAVYISANEFQCLEFSKRDLFLAVLPLSLRDCMGCPDNGGENIQYVDGPIFDFLSQTNLIIDQKISDSYFHSDGSLLARRPYFRLRGKRVTEEQAFEIIRRTDEFFQMEINPAETVSILHFPNWWFHRNHYPAHYGWCHPNGIIGLNGITAKWPNMHELLEDMVRLKFAFPYLDFVVAITYWDEIHPEMYGWRREIEKKIKGPDRQREALRQLEYRDYPEDFLADIELGLWLHGNTIEFMEPDRTRQVYQEYEAKYGEANKDIYVPEYYQDHGGFRADISYLSYLRLCIKAHGLDPDKELAAVRDYIWRGK